MTNLALITGASSGIGKEFARYHAQQGGDLIITARREQALIALKEELESKHGVTVHTIPMDLAATGGARGLINAVHERGLEVEILINNAGFGGFGLHTDRTWAEEEAMIDVNIKTLVELTHAFAQQMVKRGRGKILNVASTAGMLPGPFQANYYATKAYVLSYSQALNEEFRPLGVSVTALAPGLVATEFVETANLGKTNFSNQSADNPKNVAKVGYDGMMENALVAFNDSRLKFMLNWITPLLPRRSVLKMVRRLQTETA